MFIPTIEDIIHQVFWCFMHDPACTVSSFAKFQTYHGKGQQCRRFSHHSANWQKLNYFILQNNSTFYYSKKLEKVFLKFESSLLDSIYECSTWRRLPLLIAWYPQAKLSRIFWRKDALENGKAVLQNNWPLILENRKQKHFEASFLLQLFLKFLPDKADFGF